MQSNVARRYAKALFELAQKENRLDAVRPRLEEIDRLIQSQAPLRDLCRNPAYSIDEKKRVLSMITERTGSPALLSRLIDLLIQKNRLRLLPEIAKAFGRMVDEAQGREHVRVRAAKGLSASEETGLRKRLEAILQKKVELKIETDSSLIGGMVVYAGSRVFDGSVKGQLQGLRRELVK